MSAADILQWWSFIFLGVLVYYVGKQVKRTFPSMASQQWYVRTVVFHAPVAATAIAALPWFPMPEAVGAELGTRLLFGGVAGICSSWSYKALMRLTGRDTKSIATEDEEDFSEEK